MFEKKVSDEERKRLEKEAKKAKRAERKDKSKKESKGLSIVKTLVLPAVFAAILCMVIYLALESKAEAASTKVSVLCVKEDIAPNTYIDFTDADSYFESVAVEMNAVPETAITAVKDLPKNGFYVENSMKKSQMVLKDDVADKDTVMDKYKEGYEVTSLAAESFSGSVNGRIRTGDIVDIYAVNPVSTQLELMAENVYVKAAYDSSGNVVTTDDQVAVAVTVYVTDQEVERVNLAVTYGGIQTYLKR